MHTLTPPPKKIHSSVAYTTGTWNRIVMGSTQGLDTDLCAGASWCHKLDWNVLAHTFYTRTLVYSLQMTDAMLSNGRFRGVATPPTGRGHTGARGHG